MKDRRKKYGNANAAKTNRRLELGWLHETSPGLGYKQVRLRNGGGTRNLRVEKSCTIKDIHVIAMSMFFPDGHSKLGSLDDMETDVRDFKGDKLDLDMTVQAHYDHFKVKMMRMYLYTSLKKQEVFNISVDIL